MDGLTDYDDKQYRISGPAASLRERKEIVKNVKSGGTLQNGCFKRASIFP